MPDDFDYSQRPQRAAAQQPAPPITTFLLMGICLVASIPEFQPGLQKDPFWAHIMRVFEVPSNEIWSGQFQGMLTSVFAHGGYMHFLFNMMWLYQLGMVLELTIGPLMMVLLMSAAGIVASGAELALTGQTGIGFSGIVYALFGMMWAGRGKYPMWAAVATSDNWRYMIGWAVLCVVATYFGWMRVANAAHFGGLLFGVSLGFAFFAPRKRPLWIIPMVLLIVLTIMSVVWMPWNPEWRALHMGV